eukprot:5845373-Pleurochrysis_carterae.AAC.2
MLRKGTVLSDENVRKHCIQNLGSREGLRIDEDGVKRFTGVTVDQKVVNLNQRANYDAVRRMIIDKDEEGRLLKHAEVQQAQNIGEVVLTKRSNSYRVYNQEMREYNRLTAKGIIGLSLPLAPDAQIIKHNRFRPRTQSTITNKSLQDYQREFRKYIDANSRLTFDEKNDMYHTFNLHQSTKPAP